MSWVPLHVHSQYSILDASAPVKALAKKAAEFKMPAAALTDHGNMFGAIDFYQACQAVQVKPIVGCEVYVAPGSRLDKTRLSGSKTAFHLVLLAKNIQGYRNLCKLTSIGYQEGFYYHPRIDKEVLQKHHEGIICLSACLSGSVAQAALYNSHEEFLAEIRWHRELFGEDYYLELQRHAMSPQDIEADGMLKEPWLIQSYQDYMAKQEKVNTLLLEAAKELKIKYVATNDSHYIYRDDWKAHEILLNVQSGEPCEIWEKDSLGNLKARVANPKRRTYSSHEVYFKSPEQMQALFSDIPEAISTSLEIANKCQLDLDFKSKHYPVYVPPTLEGKTFSKEERAQSAESYLRDICEAGIAKRYTPESLEEVRKKNPGKDPLQVVRERLELELSVIIPKGLGDYLLIVYDFISWAKRNNIPMGPGRGSGVGSIVLYLIEVTDIEPLRFNLFFERFINPERPSYPDIDVDICMDRRQEVIDYTINKYGKEKVAQIITFGTMKAKMAIKDVGRVLSVPLAKVNEIAKLVPEDLGMTLEKALEVDQDLRALYESNEDAKRIIDIGKSLEGAIRSTGIHAAGIIVCGDPLTDHIPVCVSKDSDMTVTQFSMKPVEAVGMLKIDFLGLKTLTCIKKAVEMVKATSGKAIDWVSLPLDDQQTFDLFNQGRTLGVFQIETGGMQEVARQLHIDKFEELIAVTSLYRPGPMGMIPTYINRKHGKEAIEYDHPWMKEILEETYGIMVYQEHVIQIASKLANYTLGEGDALRKAMGKKVMEEMVTQREKFRAGALKNNIDETTSMSVFDKMEKFASYGFNKSHAAAYAYLSYVTAYFKAHYPKIWMAALMTCVRDDLSKVAKFIRECHTINIPILPPDINESGDEFAATPQGIRFALSGIKGVGAGVVEAIIHERMRKGHFKSLYDFVSRVDIKRVGKKTIELLVGAGSFDFTGWSRDALRESSEPMYDAAVKEQKESAAGIMSLFSLIEDQKEKSFTKPPEVKNKTTKNTILAREKELLGFYLTGHPLDAFKEVMGRLSCAPLHEFEQMDDGTVFRTAFIVESADVKIASKTQKKFAILTISDGMEGYELPIWSELYEEKSPLLRENQLLYAVLQVEKKEESIKLVCRWFDDLNHANEAMIDACDRAYDKAKLQVARFSLPKAKKTEKPSSPGIDKKKEAPKEIQRKSMKICLTVDAQSIRLSHILELKALFRANAGNTPIQVVFREGESLVGSIAIDQQWGIAYTEELKKSLQKVPGVVAIAEE